MPRSYPSNSRFRFLYTNLLFSFQVHVCVLSFSLIFFSCDSSLTPEEELESLWELVIVDGVDKETTLKLCQEMKILARIDSTRFADYLVAASAKASTISLGYKQWESHLKQGQRDCRRLRPYLTTQNSLHTWVLLDYEEARFHDSKGELQGAQDRYEKVWKELEKINADSTDRHQLHNFQHALPISLAGIHQFLGNYKLAENWLDKADPVIDWQHPVYPGIILGLRAQILQAKGQLTEAMAAYKRANKLFLKNNNDSVTGHYVENCMFYSELLLKEKLTSTAKAVLQKAARHRVRGDRYPIYLSFQLAKIALTEGNFRKARDEAKLSLSLSQEVTTEKYYWHARILKVLAEIELAEQNWEVALNYAQQGLDQFSEKDISSTFQKNPDLESLDNKLDVLPLLILKAKAILGRFKAEERPVEELDLALASFADAIQLVRKLRSEYEDDEVKEALAGSSYQLFEPALETSYLLFAHTQEQKYLHEGLKITETSRSLSLQENLRAQDAQQLLAISAEKLSEERTLKYKISKLEKELQYLKAGIRKQEKKVVLAATRAEYYNWQEDIRQAFPGYHQLKYAEESLKLKDIQAQLRQDLEILSFFWGQDHVYCLRLSQENLGFSRVSQTQELRLALQDFRQEIISRRGGTSTPRLKKLIQAGHTIYQHLLQPLGSLAKELLIVSDGPLQYIPIIALPTSMIETEDPKKIPYFIHDKTIRRIFSVAVWLRRARTRESERKADAAAIDSLLVLAPSNFPDDSQLSLHEAGLGEAIGKKVRIVDEVSKDLAKDLLRRNYKYVLVFSHAAASENGPYIQLSTDSLHLDEIYHTEMGTSFIILGACETGLGENRKGEGILSIGRAFIYQDVPNAAMTLWEVQDGPALRITEGLLKRHIIDGLDPAEALRQAQIATLDEPGATGLPYQWAGFVLTGQ